ncbi:MAG: hypothetical protein U5K84_11625 [Alkalibacterium sp.]|nr:hypothetical protein [Alkalibacterium sp.]
MSPKWYSANVYLYIDELETNALYIGDIREDGDNIMLNRDICRLSSESGYVSGVRRVGHFGQSAPYFP